MSSPSLFPEHAMSLNRDQTRAFRVVKGRGGQNPTWEEGFMIYWSLVYRQFSLGNDCEMNEANTECFIVADPTRDGIEIFFKKMPDTATYVRLETLIKEHTAALGWTVQWLPRRPAPPEGFTSNWKWIVEVKFNF